MLRSGVLIMAYSSNCSNQQHQHTRQSRLWPVNRAVHATVRSDLISLDWLLAHASTAVALDNITVQGGSCDGSYKLQLPVQQLTALRSLGLSSLNVRVSRTSNGGQHTGVDSSAELPPELSALTRLVLSDCPMQLAALPSFTQLQQLCLIRYYGHAAVSNSTMAALATALPRMQLMTFLSLQGPYAADAAVSAVQHLLRLQDLLLEDCRCKAASFAALPASLTRLQLNVPRLYGDQASQGLVRSPSSTPGFAQLTALKELRVYGVYLFDAALLDSMRSL